MKLRPSHLIASAATLTILALGGSAVATPGSGFGPPTAIVLGHFAPLDVKADKTEKWDMYLKTKDNTDIGVDRIAVAAGGQSGWHAHAGPVFITVTAGSIVRYDGSDSRCPATTYRAGHTFVEDPNLPHLIRNASGSDPAEFVAVQIRPEGSPGRIDTPQPGYCS